MPNNSTLTADFIQINCNCPDQDVAENLAKVLVENKLAACVNIIAPVRSIYRWQGNIEHDIEYQLQIKTTLELYPQIQDKLQSLHPYDVPEIIALPIIAGYQPYLDWIRENT